MNDTIDKLVELQDFSSPRRYQDGTRNLAYIERIDSRPPENIFFNESLRSRSRSQVDDTLDRSLSIDSDDAEGEGLLEDMNYPNPNIAGLILAIYDYCRFGLAGFLFLWSFVLIFTSSGVCSNGSGSLKKLPPVSKLGVNKNVTCTK